MKSSNQPQVLWHSMSQAECFEELESGPDGLTQSEAERRLAEYGPNQLETRGRTSPWTILISQFKNFLILILLVAVVLSAFLGHAVEATAIGVIVLFAALLGFVQEFRAERSMEALREMAAPTANVIREGRETKIAARELVCGDIVVLHAGDKVPADGRLLDAANLQAEEAALTGESVPVQKQTGELPAENLSVADRTNMVYSGTAISYGRGRALISATGMETEFGKVAKMLQSVEAGRTPLQDNLDKVGKSLTRAALAIVAVIVVVGLLRGQPAIEMLVFGVALAVAVVPEALPAVVTISLAIGVQRMVRKNALVRRLTAVETLGSTTVICTDKTGTLTKDEMTARKVHFAGRTCDVSGAGYEPKGEFSENNSPVQVSEPLTRLLEAATLASDSHIRFDEQSRRWEVQGDPTEGALVVAAAKAGLDKRELDNRFPRVHEIPFTSETKRMTTLHSAPTGQCAFSKGAPEVILESCRLIQMETGEQPLDQPAREKILGVARQMAEEALRVLAVAWKPNADHDSFDRGMTFLGLVGMIDPPRPEVRAAIDKCKEAGIKVVMITGDHPTTAQAVARELGVLNNKPVVTGGELDSLDDQRLLQKVEEIVAYARVSPAHKLRVVTALQNRGHIAAMTGDGVNDAPALKKAAIGIAMGITGTDVTKEAADMTLTDDNFASIVAAIEEGRGIFGNIKKYLMYLLSANIGEIGLMGGAAVMGLPLPLSAVQLLYVNLATDGLPALALAVDPPEPDLMQQRPRDPHKGIFTKPVVVLMLAGGLWSMIVNLALFAWANSHRTREEAMSLTFVTLVLIEFFKAYNFRSDHHSLFVRPFANRWLNMAIIWEMLLLLLIIYIPFLNVPFKTTALSALDWAIAAAVAVTICPVLELVKWFIRKRVESRELRAES